MGEGACDVMKQCGDIGTESDFYADETPNDARFLVAHTKTVNNVVVNEF